ncbi:ankyrin [Auriscalpium vulgare]|uniref:Ankyrin n=1 Tax=Auriscalpium vulgare TaxID=40419 RepID=A0ACB8RGH9_9AGAM|nr:ankyrin [Auriscalpium vulgare]
MSAPTTDDKDDVLLACRYGELDELKQFVDRYGVPALVDVRDDNGNTVLHMVCANGHTALLDFLLPIVPGSLLSVQNTAGSTALHWAALNAQLGAARALVDFPDGPGIDLIDIKNNAGRSPLGEAEVAGWEEGARWMVEVMRLDDAGKPDEDEALPSGQDIEVEIQDADGQIAKMSLGASKPPPS